MIKIFWAINETISFAICDSGFQECPIKSTNLKKCWEYIGFTPGKQEEGKKGAEAAVEDGRAHLRDGLLGHGHPVVVLQADKADGHVGSIVLNINKITNLKYFIK